NDAGLVAESLRSVGFDVVEGADLNQTDFWRNFRRFLAKLDADGTNTVAVVYIASYGFEFDGDNYLVMSDARLEGVGVIPLDAVRLSDLLRALANTPAHAKFATIDASRPIPFTVQDANLPKGLGAVEAPRRTLVAFSTAPGTTANEDAGPYGAFATAIAE